MNRKKNAVFFFRIVSSAGGGGEEKRRILYIYYVILLSLVPPIQQERRPSWVSLLCFMLNLCFSSKMPYSFFYRGVCESGILLQKDLLHHHQHAIDVLQERLAEELGVDVDHLSGHLVVGEQLYSFFEVAEGYHAVGVAVQEV